MRDGPTSEVPSDAYAPRVHLPQYPEGRMPRIMVGLLTAVGIAMSVVASSAHGDLFWAAAADAAAAAGLAAYLALPPTKKSPCRVALAGIDATELALLWLSRDRPSQALRPIPKD